MDSTIKMHSAPARDMRKGVVAVFASAALLLFAVPAQAGNLVTNGSFEDTTNGAGQLGYNTNATGWTTTGYNFLFPAGTADNVGANGVDGNLSLWGPGNGSNNGLPASSPDGGNFVAADGDYLTAPINQTINGLTVGDNYQVGFWWGASQQYTFTGDTQQYWAVSLGAQTQNTSTFFLPSHGFSGWMYQTDTFTASSSSEVLSFLAVGNVPVPPFLLLDGVSMNDSTAATPEPGTLPLLLSGFMGSLAVLRTKKWLRR